MLGIRKYRGVAIDLWEGDITTFVCDGMANAANNELSGGGVDGAIHRAAGPALREECARLGHCATGDAVMTAAGMLPAKYVIHAVGPRWRGGDQGEAALLSQAYHRILALAYEHKLRHVAIPAISSGVFGYPLEAAAAVAMSACREFITTNDFPSELQRVTHVLYDRPAYLAYQEQLFSVFPEKL